MASKCFFYLGQDLGLLLLNLGFMSTRTHTQIYEAGWRAAVRHCSHLGLCIRREGSRESVDTETVWHRERQFLEVSINLRTETSTKAKQRHGDKDNLVS